MSRPRVCEVPIYEVRATIPAIEALTLAGNRVVRSPDGLWSVELTRPPPGLVVVTVVDPDHRGRQYGGTPITCLRLRSEPEYQGAGDAGPWIRGEWVPCPTCGDALVWYEAGYVTGTRICLRGHGAQLANDGRTARRLRVESPQSM